MAFVIENQRYLWNEAVYSQSYYTVCTETRVWPIDWWQIWWPRMNFGLLFRGANFFSQRNGYLAHFCPSATKFGNVGGLAIRHLFAEFRELWSGDPVIPCGDMHQSFTDALVKWSFDNFPMFADSFSVVSIHCVDRGLDASFLYRCRASRGSSLRQHGFLVAQLTAESPRTLQCASKRD